MTDLISYGTTPEPDPPPPIANNGFWPDIEPAAFRAAERVDSSLTDERVAQALHTAIADINRQLADWQSEQTELGAQTLDNVSPPTWATAGHYPHLYRRAVYTTARAALLERYRDYSATGQGDETGQAKDQAADDYRRDARWAVSEILGVPHTTVELI